MTVPRIAIIGGGCAGTLVAAQMLRQARGPVHVILIERSPPAGRGIAYRTKYEEHLLNVPVARMSAWADDPEHFLRWVQKSASQLGRSESVGSGDFLPRRIYGLYLSEVLEEARRNAAPQVTFEVVGGEAVNLEETEAGGRITLAGGSAINASSVVLALGNLPGEYPVRRALPFYRSPRYIHVPWAAGALEGLGRQDDLLIVGAGLTAVDIVIQCRALGHGGIIHALSRHGLRPRAHRPGLPHHPSFLDPAALPVTVRAAFKRVRQEVRAAAARGVDWRAVVEASGRLKFHAGRLTSLQDQGGIAAVTVQIRGTTAPLHLRIAKVINCTGPRTDYSKYQHPLFINLLAAGLIGHDPLALGIAALPEGEVLRYNQQPVGWLYTIGAPLKGTLWESTAVPEIRVQAERLAKRILAAERRE